MSALVMMLVGVPVLTWLLQRDMRRAVVRIKFSRISAALGRMQRQIGEQLMPALMDMIPAAKRATEAMRQMQQAFATTPPAAAGERAEGEK